MPFTPAHVAAVLPVIRVRSRWVVPVAWVVGSMVPDLAWFLVGSRAYGLGHSALGLVTLDLALGVVLVAGWRFVALGPVRDLAPTALAERLPRPSGVTVREWPGVVVGVVAGAATHVVWDSFTHRGRWGARHLDLLAATYGPLPGYKYAQYASGVVGVLLVVVAMRRWWRVTVRAEVTDRRVAPAHRVTALAGVSVLAVVRAVARAGAALLVGGLAVCGAWWALPRRAAAPAG
ncbi:DUF4184 family protein [Phycicoccus sp. CSK15P-2]|uniref:DUF4184 family protein n=1 Tax=Phycicoccus sp. CSK15P-2 TaxID=2807627 RepID=UPI00194E9A31|nr:DUF4184 family protein [Phycicoccus sp. CSK15P-2]MBM6403803.1 DUF4184 family protein [Phycicoccus sp. CSK15P-2]